MSGVGVMSLRGQPFFMVSSPSLWPRIIIGKGKSIMRCRNVVDILELLDQI